MGVEIERKFLVTDDSWRAHADAATRIRQGYLTRGADKSVRVRRVGDAAVLTVKAGTGLVRAEYEYPIPVTDADDMLASLCEPGLIDKTRHLVRHAGRVWEVDVFEGDHAGLVLAEVELPTADAPLELPTWAGVEVTDDPAYTNAALSRPTAPPVTPLARRVAEVDSHRQ